MPVTGSGTIFFSDGKRRPIWAQAGDESANAAKIASRVFGRTFFCMVVDFRLRAAAMAS